MKKIFYLIVMFTTISIINNKIYAYNEYRIGDEVVYNRMKFYVIKKSSSEENYVVLLKKKPLTVNEVNNYGGVGTDNNYINKYTQASSKKAANNSGYGGAVFYTSEECGYVNNRWNINDCKSDYNSSDVKHIVDSWGSKKFDANDLVTDSTGYTVRLLTVDELKNNLGYSNNNSPTTNTPTWVYDFQFFFYYWIMDARTILMMDGSLRNEPIYGYDFSGSGTSEFGIIRPVVTIKKLSLNKVIDDEENESTDKDYISPAQETYKIGDEIVYKGEKYYVIKNSSEEDDVIILLKETPLTVKEINKYGGVGTENSRVNMYVTSNELAQYYQEAYDNNGYGGMAYLSRNNCEQVRCTNDYETSDVKYVVDAWGSNKLGEKNYNRVRLMKEEEYTDLCDIETHTTPSGSYDKYVSQYDFLNNKKYTYLLMDSEKIVGWNDGFDNNANNSIFEYYNVVRPVVELNKCAMTKSCETSEDKSINNQENSRIIDKKSTTVNVPDTLKKMSVIIIMIGIIAVSISLVVFVKNKDKIKEKK